MSWTDKGSIKHIKKIRDKFKVNTFFETGTFMGINANVQRKNFEIIITCEKIKKYMEKARKRFKYEGKNVLLWHGESHLCIQDFIKSYKRDKREDYVIFYLDAHFYDPEAKNKWVVQDELKALKGFKKAIIIIHDFDNGLGHITYDGQPLNLKLIKKNLMKVNRKFKLYTNELSSCEIVTPVMQDMLDAGLETDEETLDNLEYVWSKPEKTYRGILYALPEKVNIDGLKAIE